MNVRNIGFHYCRAIADLANDSLYKNSFFIAVTNIFNAGSGFFFWIIAARLYTIEQVGMATALISSLGLVILFSRLGFDTSIIRFFSEGNRGGIIWTSLIMTTIGCLMAGLVYILLAEFLVPSISFLRDPGYALSFLLIAVANSIASVTGSAFVADRKANYYFLQNLFLALRILALVPLTLLGIFGIFGSVGFGFLVASLFSLLMLRRSILAIPVGLDRGFIRISFRFSSWSYISSIFLAAPSLCLPIMVMNMLGETEAAKYFIATTIGGLILIIPSSLGTSLFVEGSYGKGLKSGAIRAGIISLVILVPAVLFLLIFGNRLLGLLSGEYMGAIDLLRILAISSFPVAIYSLFVPIQNVRMKVESIAKLNILRCILLLGLSYILMQRYGILGAGYAWLMTYAVLGTVIGRVMYRENWI